MVGLSDTRADVPELVCVVVLVHVPEREPVTVVVPDKVVWYAPTPPHVLVCTSVNVRVTVTVPVSE